MTTVPQPLTPTSIAVVITRMIRGGAQRIALEGLARLPRSRFRGVLITGPETGAEASLAEEARERGIEVIVLPELVREISPREDWRAFRRLSTIFREERVRIVHSHTSKAGFLASVAARRAGVPAIVYSPHGHIFGENSNVRSVSHAGALKRFLLLKLRRHAERCADRVIALNSLDLEEQVGLRLGPRQKYTIIRNGVDLSRYQPPLPTQRREVRSSLSTDEGAFVVAIVGRLGGEKGHRTLFEAVGRLASDASVPAVVVWVIGNGYLRKELEQFANQNLAAHSVRFLGMRDDVPRVLAAADVMALPSYYESQGLVFMESMALGVPVIGSRVGGVPEVVKDGETGLLVRPGEVGELAGAIRRLALDARLRRRLGDEGRDVATRDFGIERMMEHLIELYESLLAGRAARLQSAHASEFT